MNDNMMVMQMIAHGGNARSMYLKAIKEARLGHFDKARALINKANASLNIAHVTQNKLFEIATKGEPVMLDILMVHANDHLMNAMTVRDLAIEMVEWMESISNVLETVSKKG